jgi:hypothetical protein
MAQMNIKLKKLLSKPEQVLFLICFLQLISCLSINLLSRNPPIDTIEMYFVGKELVLGYPKHPMLPSWLAHIALFISQGHEIGLYLLTSLLYIITYIYIFKLGMLIFKGDKAKSLYSVIFILISPISFEPDLNHVTVQLPLWTMLCYYTYQSINHNKTKDWIFSGILAGLLLNTHYLSSILILSLIIAILYSNKSKDLMRSYKPYLATLITLAVFSPHIYYLVQNNFLTLEYARSRSELAEFDILESLKRSGMYVINILFYSSIYVLTFFSNFRIKKNPNKFILICCFTPFIIGLLISLAGTSFKTNWIKPFAVLTGLIVFNIFELRPRNKKFIPISIILFLCVSIIIFTVNNLGILKAKKFQNGRLPSQKIYEIILKDNPDVKYISGSHPKAGSISLKSPNHPKVVYDNFEMSSWIDKNDFYRSKVLYIWEQDYETEPKNLPSNAIKGKIKYSDLDYPISRSGATELNWAIVDYNHDNIEDSAIN